MDRGSKKSHGKVSHDIFRALESGMSRLPAIWVQIISRRMPAFVRSPVPLKRCMSSVKQAICDNVTRLGTVTVAKN